MHSAISLCMYRYSSHPYNYLFCFLKKMFFSTRDVVNRSGPAENDADSRFKKSDSRTPRKISQHKVCGTNIENEKHDAGTTNVFLFCSPNTKKRSILRSSVCNGKSNIGFSLSLLMANH